MIKLMALFIIIENKNYDKNSFITENMKCAT